MNPGRFLRAGITASAAAHLLALMLVLFFTEVHRFGSVTAEPITVDIVSPEEAPPAPKPEEPPPELKLQPSDAFDLSSKSAPAPAPAAWRPATSINAMTSDITSTTVPSWSRGARAAWQPTPRAVRRFLAQVNQDARRSP